MSKRSCSDLDVVPLAGGGGGVVVTPSPDRKQARTYSSSSSSDEDVVVVQHKPQPPSAKRTLFRNNVNVDDDELAPLPNPPPHEEQLLAETQEPEYTQDCTEGLPTTETGGCCYGILEDVYDSTFTYEVRKPCITIGRHSSMDLIIDNTNACVSRKHCEITLHGDEYLGNTATLEAIKNCWVVTCCGATAAASSRGAEEQEWELVSEGKFYTLFTGSHIRLMPPGKHPAARTPHQEFRLKLLQLPPEERSPFPGTNSFDCQYLRLLKAIVLEEGEEQTNQKGRNLTLPRPFQLGIDLSNDKGRYLVPMTSLRSMYRGTAAITEALWYLRGEDHVRFLQENKCSFWNKQCDPTNGHVGWNYGLLTNFPTKDGSSMNQLEDNVLRPLSKLGSQSRNMVCTLFKPDEPTVQASCTSSIKFSVRKVVDDYDDDGVKTKEILDLHVTQRSSDTILGLPNDVVVWSTILHLVCREVYIRTSGTRNLTAGTLYFDISAGGAHVYNDNMDDVKVLMERKPIQDCQPYLNILGSECNQDISLDRSNNYNDGRRPSMMGMFQLAKDYAELARLARDYNNNNVLLVENNLLSVKGYENKKHHPAIKVKQAG